jgi:hypothetical protein
VSERAGRPMSASEFLAWDDGTDTRYELIDGPAGRCPAAASLSKRARRVASTSPTC